MKKHTKIQAWERDKIAILLSSGVSVRSIARQLNRSHSSILTEIKRNGRQRQYQAIAAQELSMKHNQASRKTNALKDPIVYRYVLEKLRCGWSPEQIAGRLRRKNKDKTVICHETIYQYIYSQEGKRRQLFEFLVRGHRKRRKWYSLRQYRRGIPERVSLDLRPEKANTRQEFGHWEIDSIEGKRIKGSNPGIHTFLERQTRYYQAILLPRIDSEFGVKAQLKVLGPLPSQARKSATFDNGKENYNHIQLQIQLGMQTFFCDPNAAWQKGANEHYNGVLRRYIPRRTDLGTISQIELDAIVEEINNRPAKCLGYQTPKEVFLAQLDHHQLQSEC